MTEEIHPHTETIAVLDAVRDVLSNPERWTKEFLALDEHCDDISPYSKDARCWCLLGAFARVAGALANELVVLSTTARALKPHLFPGDLILSPRRAIIWFNDHPSTTHADVLALLDETIRRLRDGR